MSRSFISDDRFTFQFGKAFLHASHRGWINPATGGYTVIPFHGSKNLPQGTLKAICRQLGIVEPKR